jgi:EKC/KEOPS complex subunit PCC1/LAGE3
LASKDFDHQPAKKKKKTLTTPRSSIHVHKYVHSSLQVPVSNVREAQIIVQTISPDKPVKSPHFIRRSISITMPQQAVPADPVSSTTFILISVAALTLRQARVSLDHLLSDLGLVVQTIATFSPDT